MRCSNCGTHNSPKSQYCSQCASPLAGAHGSGGAMGRASVSGVRLVVRRGSETGQTHTLRPGTYTLGRSSNNDVRLSESTVSRRHARIHVGSEGVHIEDLGSTVGTFVNGKRITGSAWLQPGDQVQLGSVATLEMQPLAVERPISPMGPARVAATPARPPRRRRRALVGGLIGAAALVVLALLAVTDYRPFLGGDEYLKLPNISDWSAMTEADAMAIGTIVMEQLHPELVNVSPVVADLETDGHRTYSVTYPVRVKTEAGEFSRSVVVAIDPETRTLTVLESN